MKTIKKQICVLFCILSLFACSKEESNPQYDPSNVLNALIIENKEMNNYTKIEIKKWIKQDDACILIGKDNTPILYMHGIEKDVLSTSSQKDASPGNAIVLSLRAK